MADMTLKDWLGLSVLAAVISLVGSLCALYLKEFVAVRSLERWKFRQSIEAVYDRYRRPICAAAEELSGRCYVNAIKTEDWRAGVGVDLLQLSVTNPKPTAAVDDRFFRYKLLSDVYRLCCFLGWIELYRRDLGLMNVNQTKHGRQLEICIRNLRSDLADGQKNYHPDWNEWRDTLIFREEQRAIAHQMIASPPAIGLIDFGTFCDLIIKEIKSESPNSWFSAAVLFFSNIGGDRDFRLTRMKYMIIHLEELRETLQPGSVLEEHRKGNRKLQQDLDSEMQKARQATRT